RWGVRSWGPPGQGRERGSGDVEEGAQFSEGGGNDRVVGPAALLLAREKAGVDELLHVMTDGGLADPKRLGEIARADRVAALGGDVGEQPQPSGVRQRLQHRREPLGVDAVDGPGGQRAARLGAGRRLEWRGW